MTTTQAENQYGPSPLGGGALFTNLIPSQARVATGATAAQDSRGANTLNVLMNVTAVSGTTPTMTLEAQWSHDGTTWFGAQPNSDITPSITAAQRNVRQYTVKGPYFRLTWVIGGTNPSFTFEVHAYLQD